jgi:nitrogen fixation NifU-like protein
MDQNALEFWRDHSVNFLEMALKEDKREKILNPDGYGHCSRECGDSLEIFLSARDGLIKLAAFYTDGCIYTVACANTVVQMVEGKTAQEAWAVSPRHIVDFLETLPKRERHCAELAVRALRLALLDLKQTERQPWTRLYR